jgi:uncharacterized oligopeptide transporter (OPT) family protein
MLVWQRIDWWSHAEASYLAAAAICGAVAGALWWVWVRRPYVLTSPAGDSPSGQRG